MAGKRNTMATLAEDEMCSATVDGAEASTSATALPSASTLPAAKASTKASTNHRASTQANSKAKPNVNINSYEILGMADYIVIVDNQPPKVQVMSSSESLENVKPKDISADVDVASSVGDSFCCGGNRKKQKKEKKVEKGAMKICVLL
jgi:hypothetical protein